MARDDEDKASIFEFGLRLSIFRLVQAPNLKTYRDVVDYALIMEKMRRLLKRRGKSRRELKARYMQSRVVASRTK